MNSSLGVSPGRSPASIRGARSRLRLGKSKNVIHSTFEHSLELFGPPPPVTVLESINSTSGAAETASVNINFGLGWAWYVVGRHLHVWHIPSFTEQSSTMMGKGMTLPSCDLAHSAERVTLFPCPNSPVPSCVAMSPDGIIRYWRMVGEHSDWTDVNAQLGGEEVHSIYYIDPNVLAVTTSATLVVISPTLHKETPSVEVKRFSATQGWFGDIGKKVSSIFFGSSSSQIKEFNVVRLITSVTCQGFWHVFLLTDLVLQSWAIENDTKLGELLYECDLEPIIQKACPFKENEESGGDFSSEIIISDIKPSEGGGLMALVASKKSMGYFIVEINGNDVDPPETALRMCIISNDDLKYLEIPRDEITLLKFLLQPTTAFLFSKKGILAVPLTVGEEHNGDHIEVPGCLVVNGMMYKNTPVFFCGTYGFVSVSSINSSLIDFLSVSDVTFSSTPKEILEREPCFLASPHYLFHLKIAFLHYLRKNLKQCHKIIQTEIIPEDEDDQLNSIFSTTLIKISLDILNDFPAKDPRWEETSGSNTSRTMSLHLESQLREKKYAHNHFLSFVNEISQSVDLGVVMDPLTQKNVRTIHILIKHNEKLTIALLLKKLQQRYDNILGVAVSTAGGYLNFKTSAWLSQKDIFFRYASISDEGLKGLIDGCCKLGEDAKDFVRLVDVLIPSNFIIIKIVSKVLRERDTRDYPIDNSHVSWLSSAGPEGLFDHLLKLTHLNYKTIQTYGEKPCPDSENLKESLFLLIDLLLILKRDYLSIINFNTASSSLIQLLINLNMESRALQIALKFKNFKYIIQICYSSVYQANIPEYIQSFGPQGFCNELFIWLGSKKKYHELINLEVPENYMDSLESFIEDKPHILWLFKLKKKDYNTACNILTELGREEGILTPVERERLFAVLKLIVTIKNCSTDENMISTILKRISAQKRIPDFLWERKKYEPNQLKTLSAVELIELYICDEFTESTENEFMIALSLLDCISDQCEVDDLRIKIWVKALMKDDWKHLNAHPDSFKDSVFFRLLNLVINLGNTSVIIPTINEIMTHPEVAKYENAVLLDYILEYGYEQARKGNWNIGPETEEEKYGKHVLKVSETCPE